MLTVLTKHWLLTMQLPACKFGGNVVARLNILRNIIFEFCKSALLNPKPEAGAGLDHERRLTRCTYFKVAH